MWENSTRHEDAGAAPSRQAVSIVGADESTTVGALPDRMRSPPCYYLIRFQHSPLFSCVIVLEGRIRRSI